MSAAPMISFPEDGAAPLWEVTREPQSAQQLQRLAAGLAASLEPGDLLVLSGDLGAGKTTFTQGLGRGLGVREGIISPTFVLVRIHPSLRGGPQLVHVDAYRLEAAEEVDGLDLESTMDGSVTVVEWGAGRVEHLSDSRLTVDLNRPSGPDRGPDGTRTPIQRDYEDDLDEPRTLHLSGWGPRWAAGPPGLPALD